MLRDRSKEDLERELAYWKRLAKLQDRVISAYRAGRKPADSIHEQIVKVKAALEPYIEAAALREKEN
jgi:hypothetical protein